MEQLYGTVEFCKKLGMSRTTLYRFINAGVIEPLRIGGRLKFTEEHAKQILEASAKKHSNEGENE